MYLKALEIQGFKSFPEKTVLNFGEDMTAIVGPNGSGKSNISDAIRWVMGEQNSRQLRGVKMEDVIFGGTEKRSPMGFAQVTLVIDNTEHIFTRDEAEVAVTRRYYRSGESEYYINKQSVRLKDVNELFMDTGMGREGYSIIGQGKIDEILAVKSEDRREVFEEAAGISKFRHRKEEAEKKLERTEENLLRINDKIAELELQVEPLREQSKKAKQYLLLRDELRVLEISVWLENLQALKTAAFKLQTDFETAKQDKETAEAALEAVYAASEECARQVQENDVEAEKLRGEISALESGVSEKESAVAVLRTSVEHNNDTIRRMEQEMAESHQRTDHLLSQIEEQQQHVSEIDSRAALLEEETAELISRLETIAQSSDSAARETDALRAKEALAVAAASDAKAVLSALRSGLQEVDQRRESVQSDWNEAHGKLENGEKEAAENQKALDTARAEAESISNIIRGHSMKMDGRKRRAEEAAAAKMQLTMDVGSAENRLKMLTEMEKDYEGFSRAVKLVMQARNSLRGIHGPVAGLMTTDDEYTVAIEIALGGGLQNIVVDREEDAKAAIGYLKQRDGGRATFLPMTAIRGEELRENGIENEYGFVGIASELVRHDAKYDPIFSNLLGRTVVVEDLDCGIAMARRYHNRFRIVTLDGQVINRGGSMTGGSVSRSAGVLSRANEIKHLTGQLASLREKLREAAERQENTARELQRAQYELEVAQSQQRSAEDEVLRLEGTASHFNILLESMHLACERLEAESAVLQERRETDGAKAAETEKSIAGYEAEAERLRSELDRQQAGQNDLNEQTAALSAAISEKRASSAALSAEKEASLRNIADLQQLRGELSDDRTGREELRAQFIEANDKAETEMAQYEQQIAGLRKNITDRQKHLTVLAEAKMALEARRNARDKESRECNDTLLNCEREVSRLEQKISTNALEEKQILDRLWEHYELSHSEAMEQRIELESIPKANRRIAELNREIKGLGTPNIGAIEEYERVNTRYTYLSGQRTDVEKAKEELTGIIDEITRQMTDIFAEQFKLLNESFQQTFLELFGGGRAQLELENEKDILNCGIEIKVQPPGKQLKTITLLSGGEKAFVAIALYFAILKVHPTPFCVMDEIEAALDEANVVRFARYMRTIAGKTQFIVITHRRGTMEEADVLYGVTMQERGVSRILTMNLNEVSQKLNIN